MIEDFINQQLDLALKGKSDDNTFICLTGDGKLLSVLLSTGLVFFYYPEGYPEDKTKHVILSSHSKVIENLEEDFINVNVLRKIFDSKRLTYKTK